MISPAPSTVPPTWTLEGNHVRRRLSGTEAVYVVMNDVFHGHGSETTRYTLSSTMPTSPAQFREKISAAWVATRFKWHPLIATHLERHGPPGELSFVYPIVGEAHKIDQWVQDTVLEHEPIEREEMDRQFRNRYTSPDAEYGVYLHWAPVKSKANSFHVVVQAGHWIFDGRGSFLFKNALLEEMNTSSKAFTWGNEISRLNTTFEIPAGYLSLNEDGTLASEPGFDEWNAANGAKIGSKAPFFDRPVPQNSGCTSSPSAKTINRTLRLSQSETSSLVSICRLHKVTATTLLQALMTIAWTTRPSLPTETDSGYNPVNELDTKQNLMFPVNPIDQRPSPSYFGPAIIPGPVFVPCDLLKQAIQRTEQGTKALWEIASQIRAQLQVIKADKAGIKHAGTDIFKNAITAFMNPAPFLSSSAPFLSSIGRVSDFIKVYPEQEWTPSEVGFLGKQGVPIVGHFLWEWDGQLEMSVIASDQYHDQKELDEYVNELEDWVRFILS